MDCGFDMVEQQDLVPKTLFKCRNKDKSKRVYIKIIALITDQGRAVKCRWCIIIHEEELDPCSHQ